MPTPTPIPTPEQAQALLDAAENVLFARQDQMLTVEEWMALAKAVAACTNGSANDLLTERDLEDANEGGG